MSLSPSMIRALVAFVMVVLWLRMAWQRGLATAPWRGMVENHNKSVLLVVARGAADPEGVVATIKLFNSVEEIYELAFNSKRKFEMLMLWRSPATEDGAPFKRRDGESDSDCLIRLAGELHVPEAEKQLLPARRASRLKQLGPLLALGGVSAALFAGTFIIPKLDSAPPPPVYTSTPDAPDPTDLPPAEELCRSGLDRTLCETAKTAQRGLNGNDCATAAPAVAELRGIFDGLPDEQQTVEARRAVRKLEHRRDRHCKAP